MRRYLVYIPTDTICIGKVSASTLLMNHDFYESYEYNGKVFSRFRNYLSRFFPLHLFSIGGYFIIFILILRLNESIWSVKSYSHKPFRIRILSLPIRSQDKFPRFQSLLCKEKRARFLPNLFSFPWR